MLCLTKCNNLRRQCRDKTRCLMTADGSENDMITLEGLSEGSCANVESSKGKDIDMNNVEDNYEDDKERMSSMTMVRSGKIMKMTI